MTEQPAVIGRYQVERLLGEGGMGVLYLARDPVLERLVALKLLRVDSADLRRRFVREAQSAARIQHPNIVTVYDVGDHDGQLYIAMEYIDGDTLASLIRENVPFSPIRKLDIIDEVADGLGFAHQRGIIHRDIKPANLMLTRSGLVKVLDFGIARIAHKQSGEMDRHALVGTPAYMAPEQLEGVEADARSDIYAVGLVMYELFSGRRAFSAGTTTDVLRMVLESQPTPIEQLVPSIDPDLARVIGKAMSRDPQDRFVDLQAMRKDLARARRRAMQASSDDATIVVGMPAASVFSAPPPAPTRDVVSGAGTTAPPPTAGPRTGPPAAPPPAVPLPPRTPMPTPAPVAEEGFWSPPTEIVRPRTPTTADLAAGSSGVASGPVTADVSGTSGAPAPAPATPVPDRQATIPPPPPPPLPGGQVTSAPLPAVAVPQADTGPMPVPLPSVPVRLDTAAGRAATRATAGIEPPPVSAPEVASPSPPLPAPPTPERRSSPPRAAAAPPPAPLSPPTQDVTPPSVPPPTPPVAPAARPVSGSASPAPIVTRKGLPVMAILGAVAVLLLVFLVLAVFAVRALLGASPLSSLLTRTVEPRVVAEAPAVPPAAPDTSTPAPTVDQPAESVAATEVAVAPDVPAETDRSTTEPTEPASAPEPPAATPPPSEDVPAPAASRPLPKATAAARDSRPAAGARATTGPMASAPTVTAREPEPSPRETVREDAPPPREEPVRREVERPIAPRDEALSLVRAYVAARNTSHAGGIRRVWPTVDETHLRRITSAFSAPLTLGGCSVEATGNDRATATCALTQAGTSGVYAGNQSLTIRRTFVFDLAEQGRQWVIVGLRE